MKRILVALDGSTRAPTVLAAAARLADMCQGRLVLFRAIGLPPDLPHQLFQGTPVQIEDTLRASARAELEVLAQDIKPALIERITTELATPWDGIINEAKAVDADLIVIGSHGFSGALDRVLGTTAAKVSNRADRNVMIVKTLL
jgi:nucleotide-binding universal stress UspA family protein